MPPREIERFGGKCRACGGEYFSISNLIYSCRNPGCGAMFKWVDDCRWVRIAVTRDEKMDAYRQMDEAIRRVLINQAGSPRYKKVSKAMARLLRELHPDVFPTPWTRFVRWVRARFSSGPKVRAHHA